MNWDNRAFILTSVVYTIMLFLFLFLGFTTPLPLPAEQGILINFGEDETGSGIREPRPSEEVNEQPAEATPVSTPTEEVVEEQLTQDFEEAPAVASKPEKTQQKQEEIKKKEEEVVEEKKPRVNTSALYRGKKENTEYTGSEGEAGGTGNQGNPAGDVDATSHSLGAGAGDGISFSLAGRSPVALPVPEFNTQKEGKVVVRVRVDRTGKITSAEPGVKGSTTLDKELLAAAKRAALASRFNNKSNAPMVQEGTITYVFRLKGK